MNDTRFWNAVERAESNFTGTADLPVFNRHMRKLGFHWDVIRERVEAIHSDLLPEFDKLRGQGKP